MFFLISSHENLVWGYRVLKLDSHSTIGAGIARTYIYLVTSYDKEDNPDFIADFTLFILWSEIEVNVAMIVCCMPVFGPVLGQCRDTLYRRFVQHDDGELGLLRHSASDSRKDGKIQLTISRASNGSYAHHEQGGQETKVDVP